MSVVCAVTSSDVKGYFLPLCLSDVISADGLVCDLSLRTAANKLTTNTAGNCCTTTAMHLVDLAAMHCSSDNNCATDDFEQ